MPVTKMVAPGGWSVEAINLDGVPTFRVKRLGYLADGCLDGIPGRGYYKSIDDVRRLMGDAFDLLVPAVA